MDIRKKQISNEEAKILDQALIEFYKLGKTTIACPRCKKKLFYEEYSTGYRIYCEDENCINDTCRGL